MRQRQLDSPDISRLQGDLEFLTKVRESTQSSEVKERYPRRGSRRTQRNNEMSSERGLTRYVFCLCFSGSIFDTRKYWIITFIVWHKQRKTTTLFIVIESLNLSYLYNRISRLRGFRSYPKWHDFSSTTVLTQGKSLKSSLRSPRNVKTWRSPVDVKKKKTEHRGKRWKFR